MFATGDAAPLAGAYPDHDWAGGEGQQVLYRLMMGLSRRTAAQTLD